MELPDTMCLTLRAPVDAGSVKVTELNLREPTARELADFTKALEREGAVGATILLIASVSGEPKAVVDKIGARDFKRAEAFVSRFFEDSPETGEA